MEPHTKIKVECPFCHKETLEALTWPAHTELRRSRSAVVPVAVFFGFYWALNGLGEEGRFLAEVNRRFRTTT